MQQCVVHLHQRSFVDVPLKGLCASFIVLNQRGRKLEGKTITGVLNGVARSWNVVAGLLLLVAALDASPDVRALAIAFWHAAETQHAANQSSIIKNLPTLADSAPSIKSSSVITPRKQLPGPKPQWRIPDGTLGTSQDYSAEALNGRERLQNERNSQNDKAALMSLNKVSPENSSRRNEVKNFDPFEVILFFPSIPFRAIDGIIRG